MGTIQEEGQRQRLRIESAAEAVAAANPGAAPETVIILGTGLGGLVEEISDKTTVDYSDRIYGSNAYTLSPPTCRTSKDTKDFEKISKWDAADRHHHCSMNLLCCLTELHSLSYTKHVHQRLNSRQVEYLRPPVKS